MAEAGWPTSGLVETCGLWGLKAEARPRAFRAAMSAALMGVALASRGADANMWRRQHPT